MTRLQIAVLAAACAALFGARLAAQDAKRPGAEVVFVEQRERAEGLGRGVRFDDVATLTTADPATEARLRALEVASFGPSGVPPLVARERLSELLRSEGFSADATRFSGSTTTRVDIRPVVLTAAQAVDLAKRRVFEALGREAVDARIVSTTPLEDLSVPPGRRRTSFEARLPTKGRLAGPVKVDIVALVDEEPTRSLTVLLDVRRRGPALVAARELRPGTVVAADDVRVEVRDLGLLPSETLAAPELAIGSIVARRIGAGAALAEFDLKARPVVLRGDEVQLRFEIGGLVVVASGRALKDGAVGDRIEVLRAGERKPVEGRVLDARRVDVTPATSLELQK